MKNLTIVLEELNRMSKGLKLTGYSKLNSYLQNAISSERAATKIDALIVIKDELLKMESNKDFEGDNDKFFIAFSMTGLCTITLVYYSLKGAGCLDEIENHGGSFDDLLRLIGEL